jgi:Tol biopolymer transport system component
MPTGKPTIILPATIAALLAFAIFAPLAVAVPANYEDISADGKVAFFTTTDKLVSGDTDSRRDVYMRSFDSVVGSYVTREISTGPSGGNDAFDSFFNRASGDGTQVFFSTDERLIAADTDQASDVYLRDLSKGITVLVSQGDSGCAPACGNGAANAGFADANVDGAAAFFSTDERLAAADTDGAADIYRRDLDAGTTTLVSVGAASCAPACGNGDETATLRGLSDDGSTAFFATFESLATADTDTAIDVYERDLPGGPTTLVTQGDAGCAPTCGNDDSADVSFAGSSQDGTIAFFESKEGLVPGDGDGGNDVYRRAGGATTLVSGGTQAEKPANFAAASTTGSTVFFVTAESLVGGGDTNGATDVYLSAGGAPSLVTSGKCCDSNFGSATADGTKVVFTTTEKLSVADTDSSADVYEQEIGGGAPTLVSQGAASCEPSCGNDAIAAIFNSISADASKVFFSSVEVLAGDDGDSNADIYVHDLGDSTTTLVSAEGVFCPTPGGCDAIFRATSNDGARVFFQTTERLTEGDGDSELDVYERAATETRLVSTGNSVELGPSTPVLTGTNPASPAESTTPAVVGQADSETSIKVYTTPDCSGEVVATGTAVQLGSAGIAATVATGSTTSFRVTATDESGDTSACSNAVTYTQESAPPPPPPPGEGSGGNGSGGTGGGSGSAKKGGGKPGVVYVTPHTRITFAPAGKTLARRPVFRFTDSTEQEGTTFSCKIDRGGWRGCGSPTKLKALKIGRHVFQVKAVNAVGETEPAPQKRRFKVVRG